MADSQDLFESRFRAIGIATFALALAIIGCGGSGSSQSTTPSGSTSGSNSSTSGSQGTSGTSAGTTSGGASGSTSGATSGSTTGATSGSTSGSTNPAPGACLASYVPNYGDAIQTSTDPNVAGVLLKWRRFPLMVYFVKDTNWNLSLQNTALGAFGQWAQAAGNAFAIQTTTDSAKAMVTVNFQPQLSLGQNTLGITTDTYDSNNVIRSVKMQLASDLDPNSTLEMNTHEFGHALGISGHSPRRSDIMYYALLSTSPTQPQTQDVNTLQGLYCGTFATIAGNAEFGPLKSITLRCTNRQQLAY